MRRALVIALLALTACSSSPQQQGQETAPATAARSTRKSSRPASCLNVPASFFADIGVRGKVVKSGAIKSAVRSVALDRDVFEVAARFSDGSVAVWSTEQQLVGGGPTFPQNAAARKHSDQGVDAPRSALPHDPAGVSSAQACVT